MMRIGKQNKFNHGRNGQITFSSPAEKKEPTSLVDARKLFVRKYSLQAKNNAPVHLIVEDTTPRSGMITIVYNDVACSTQWENCGINGVLDFFCNKSADCLIESLMTPKERLEFDLAKCIEDIELKIKALFESYEGDNQEKFEDFWDENSYSLENCETPDEFAAWVSRIVPSLDDEDLHYSIKRERYTVEARSILEEAIPTIKSAYKENRLL